MFIPDVIANIIVDYRMGLNTVVKRNELVKDMAKYYFNVYPMRKYFQRWTVNYIDARTDDSYERPTPIHDYNSLHQFLHSQKTDYWKWRFDVAQRRAAVLLYPQFYDDDGYKKPG